MNTQSSAMPESFDAPKVAPRVMSETRPLYWSVRRELWENRSIYLAPLAAAGVYLLAYMVAVMRLPHNWRALSGVEMIRRHAIAEPYDVAAGLMMATAMIVSVFYCLDALHGERRDRSILFWKSLPVSDVTTVLAKACIPLVILPLLTFAITVVMQWLMLLLSSAVLPASGLSVTTFWTNLSFLRRTWLLLYHLLTAHALWPAPIYCWLLLVSGWPRRATFLWAALPLVQIAFHTWHFATLIGSRLLGDTPTVASTSPNMFPTDPMTHIAPAHFLISPGLWIGLALAAVFLAAAVRLRRYREPI